MKRIVLNYLVVAVIAAFTSCNKNDENDNGEVRLLETITESNGNLTKFEYDNQNRITKLSLYRNGNLTRSQTITYSGKDLVKMEEEDNSIHEFVKKGNTIADKEGTLIIYLNSDETIGKLEEIYESRSQVIACKYKGGNMTNLSVEGEIFADYQYDHKKSLFHHCKTPKWYLMLISEYAYGNKNNITLLNHHWGVTMELQYEYDSAGFPTQCTKTSKWPGELPETVSIEYKYK